MITAQAIQRFAQVALGPDPDLAVAALMIARLEYPHLDAAAYLERLDVLGQEAAVRVAEARPAGGAPAAADPEGYARVLALNDYLFRELRFAGNETQYEDPRNSCLNEVLDRRTGIPITLALVYMEVARRAGVDAEGVNFPGHFLVRCPARRLTWTDGAAVSRQLAYDDLIIDAYHGALLSEEVCRARLLGHAGGDGAGDTAQLGQATKLQMLVRMLVNLKRVYVKMGSFPQAMAVTELLLALDPSAAGELRDRGLIASRLNDWSSALRDLQAYLQMSSRSNPDEEGRQEQADVWEQVKTLRRRVASLN